MRRSDVDVFLWCRVCGRAFEGAGAFTEGFFTHVLRYCSFGVERDITDIVDSRFPLHARIDIVICSL